MNHSDIQAHMADYLDGDLSLSSRALFDAHLDQCDGCSRELAEMRDTIRLLRALPKPEPPVDLVRVVMQRIAEGEGQAHGWGRFWDQLSQWVVPRIAIPVTAVAAALMLTVLTGNLGLGGFDLRKALGVPAPGIATLDGTMATSSIPVAPPSNGRGQVRLDRNLAQQRGQQLTQQLTPNRKLQAQAAEQVQVARRDLWPRYNEGSRSGKFLYRVASDLRGPTRRQPREGDVAYRMFHVSNSPAVGPYPPASMPPRMFLGDMNLMHAPRLARESSAREFEHGMTPVNVTRIVSTTDGREQNLSQPERKRHVLDTRLASLREDPSGFAHALAKGSLAERELWLPQLAARALEVGQVEQVMSALEGSGDEEALKFARDFDMAVKHSSNRAGWADAGAVSSSD